MRAKIIKVFGRVQGVGFRAFVSRMAHSLQINGFVKNIADGSVYIEAEGNDDQIQMFINKCKEGPSWSNVTHVELEDTQLKNFPDFHVSR